MELQGKNVVVTGAGRGIGEALALDPERFRPAAAAQRHRFAYLPFGGGPRICIGNSFALAESQVVVAAIAQRYRVRLAPGHMVKPIGLLTLRPKGGIWVTLEPRETRGTA